MRIATMVGVVVLLAVCPDRASAQAFEVGAGVALSCKGIEQDICTYNWGRVDAVHAAWWSSPSLVVEGRVAHLDGPATRIVAVIDQISPSENFSRSYSFRDERRTLLQGSVLYHFRDGRLMRPFVGGGFGSIWWRGEAFCAPEQIGCRRALPAGAPGVLRAREWVAAFAGGVAVEAGHGAIVRFGLRGTETPATTFDRSQEGMRRAVRGQLPEFFVNAGYRW